MIAERFPAVLDLSDEEKLQLAGELFVDVIGDEKANDPELAELIEARLAEYRAHPDRVTSWDEVKRRLRR